jgi:hypothetical protein
MKKNIVFVCLSFSSVQFFLHSRVANRSQSQNQQSFNNQPSQQTTSDISQDNNDDSQQQNPQQPINNSNSYINNIKTAGMVAGGLAAGGAIVGTVQNKMDRIAETKEEDLVNDIKKQNAKSKLEKKWDEFRNSYLPFKGEG